MKKKLNTTALCGTCDAIYDELDAEQVKIHQHPEPQSGQPRDDWLKSRLPYEKWIQTTPEGIAWEAQKIITRIKWYPLNCDNLVQRRTLTLKEVKRLLNLTKS
jgi:hypothetical protein